MGSGRPNSSNDFTIISGETFLKAPKYWRKRVYNLDQYVNQTIRVGIHCVSEMKFLFAVDDFKVTTAENETQCFLPKKSLVVYPNPAHHVLDFALKNGLRISKVHLVDFSGKLITRIPEPRKNCNKLL